MQLTRYMSRTRGRISGGETSCKGMEWRTSQQHPACTT